MYWFLCHGWNDITKLMLFGFFFLFHCPSRHSLDFHFYFISTIQYEFTNIFSHIFLILTYRKQSDFEKLAFKLGHHHGRNSSTWSGFRLVIEWFQPLVLTFFSMIPIDSVCQLCPCLSALIISCCTSEISFLTKNRHSLKHKICLLLYLTVSYCCSSW